MNTKYPFISQNHNTTVFCMCFFQEYFILFISVLFFTKPFIIIYSCIKHSYIYHQATSLSAIYEYLHVNTWARFLQSGNNRSRGITQLSYVLFLPVCGTIRHVTLSISQINVSHCIKFKDKGTVIILKLNICDTYF